MEAAAKLLAVWALLLLPALALMLLPVAFEKIPAHLRGLALMTMTALVVSYVRSQLQYGHPPWTHGALEFLSIAFVHYIGITLLVVGPVVVVEAWRARVFGLEARTVEAIVVDVCLVLLVLCLLWTVHHLKPPGFWWSSEWEQGE